MNEVQPIRSKKQITNMKALLKNKGDKYYIMFLIGINSGLRVSDCLNLKVSDVSGKEHITITEKKTGKVKRFVLHPSVRKEVQDFIDKWNLSEDTYLIKSRQGGNKPISRVRAYGVLNECASSLGLESIGTHTMRKTFGYWYYQKTRNIEYLQYIFNHSSPSITLRYIGITQDRIDASLADFCL